MPPGELAAFRPQRLLLHELLIRVTADLSVPDGSRIEDLGINFRRMTGVLLKHHLEPQMPAIVAAFEHTRAELTAAIEGWRARSAATLACRRSPHVSVSPPPRPRPRMQ